jgi:hypothetical protein
MEQNPSILIYVLAMDGKSFAEVRKLRKKGNVTIINLADIELYHPNLTKVKEDRDLKEYYATITPVLPQYLFDNFNEDIVIYTDADMAFWSDPAEIIEVFDNYSLMVTDHGFEPPYPAGRFNVGILVYRNDKNCREFLDWWRDKCIEWCKWVTMPDGRMADQGYLNILHDEPDRFKNVLSCPHPGINLGPWKINKHNISNKNNKLIIDDKWNLICYHYHEFRVTGPDSFYPTGWKHKISDRRLVYEPYFKKIIEEK